MCIVHLRVSCPDVLSELLVDDVEGTEMAIEAIVSTALLEVFDAVYVENITVRRSPEREDDCGEPRAA